MTVKQLRDLLNIPVTEDGYTDDTEVFIYDPDNWPLLDNCKIIPMIARKNVLDNTGKLVLVFSKE